MKGRHLAAVAIALVVVGAILFFGWSGGNERADRHGPDDAASIPGKVEAASLPAAAATSWCSTPSHPGVQGVGWVHPASPPSPRNAWPVT